MQMRKDPVADNATEVSVNEVSVNDAKHAINDKRNTSANVDEHNDDTAAVTE